MTVALVKFKDNYFFATIREEENGMYKEGDEVLAVDDFTFLDCTIEKIINTNKEKFPRDMEEDLVVLPKQRAQVITTRLASDEKFDNPELIAKLKQFSASGKYERIEGIENANVAIVYDVTLAPKESKENEYDKMSMDDYKQYIKLGRDSTDAGVFLKVYLSSDAIKERQTVTIHKFADVVGLARLHEMNGIVVNAKTDRIRIDDENIQKLFGK